MTRNIVAAVALCCLAYSAPHCSEPVNVMAHGCNRRAEAARLEGQQPEQCWDALYVTRKYTKIVCSHDDHELIVDGPNTICRCPQ